MDLSRITIFAGHYGSGKTSAAVGYALHLRNMGLRVAVCDLDIVNPYFRTLDALDMLNKNGIELISSKYANTNVDLPSVPKEAQAVFDNPNVHAVIDVGGDDRGALALGRYAPQLNRLGYEMLLVINKYRPATRDIESLAEMRASIETASKLTFTGLLNNSNLGPETTAQLVRDSIPFANDAADALGLPLKMTTAAKRFENGELSGDDIFFMELYEKQIWKV